MRKLSHRVTAALILALLWCGAAQAQLTLTGAGLGSPTVAAGYQGPGDVGLTYSHFYSCARAYNATVAAAISNMCDLVDSAAPTVVICTLRTLSTGFVDLTAYCPGSVTPAAKCAAATGAVCNVSQVYDQVGANPAVVATAVNQPQLTFSALNGLPGMTCATGAVCVPSSAGSVTIAQPLTLTSVYKRTANPTTIGGIIGSTSAGVGASTTSGDAMITGGTEFKIAGATEGSYNSVTGLASGTGNNCAVNINGSDTASGNCNTTGISATTIRLMRATGSQLAGTMLEAGIISATTTPTNRGTIYTNQHGTNGYNGGV